MLRGTIERDPLWNQMVDLHKEYDRIRDPLKARDIYLLDTWAPGPLRRMLSSDSALTRARGQLGIAAQANRMRSPSW